MTVQARWAVGISAVMAILMLTPTCAAMDSDARAEVPGPPWFVDATIYYQDFTASLAEPAIDTAGLVITTHGEVSITPPTAGFIGRGLSLMKGTLDLHGAALSPHRPLTISFWWMLPMDLPLTGNFGLISLSGHGYISSFVSGKGDWCALDRPSGVLQLQKLAGIGNVNDLYDRNLGAHVALTAGTWHHTALVFSQAVDVSLIIDGRLVGELTANGRRFRAQDRLDTLTCGGGLIIDELAILDRAVDAPLIADYVRGMLQIRGEGLLAR